MARVIVLDDIAAEGLKMLDDAPGIEYDIKLKLAGDELKSALAEYDGAICRSGVKITPESLEGNTRLKAIVRAGVGTDNIDKPAATRQGIVVMNTPTGNTLSTAEHAFALMMALSRNVAPANQSLVEGRWDRKLYMGAQLADKTIGIVGLGRIGLEVASRASAFKMRVIGFDPFMTPERAQQYNIELVENVTDMLPRIDYLTVHTPLNDATRNMIDAAAIETLKPGARLINCARGGIYNEAALIEGLKSGKIGGVALDVYENEPCKESPLFGMDNVVCTPHLGASTEEAQTNVALEACELMINFLTTGEIRHSVNVAAIDPKTLDSLRGYLNVAYRLGLLQAQWNEGAVKSCKLTYRGEIADRDTKLLSAAFCVGLLENAFDDALNIINAEVMLRERGIELVSEATAGPGAFASSITANVTSDKQSTTASGTLFGSEMPRLVRLNDFRLEAYLDGQLLVFEHRDVPGIIGKIGTTFGGHDVNIAQMSVGRATDQAGGTALGVLNLDAAPPDAALTEILAHDGVTAATSVTLPPSGSLPSWLQS